MNDSSEVIFAIVETKELNRLIGSVALYKIHDSQAEVGRILIGDAAAHGKGIGRKALGMAMTAGFEYLKLEKIVGSVSSDNVQAYRNDMRVGFRVVGNHTLQNGIVEDEIEISYEELKNVNNYVEDIELID